METGVMPKDELTMRIAVAWRDLRRAKTLTLSHAIPSGQLDTMDLLSTIGPCSMIELSTALRIDASSATRAVDRLVAAGTASRRRSDDDGRTVVVELTPEGRELARQLTRERLRHLSKVLDGIDVGEREQIAASLERLLAASDIANS
jgi:DNA-binding MarR family transcriptional regulator